MGPWLQAQGQQAQGGNTAELRHRAGSAHPCSPSLPEHGPKNRCNQVSKRKRNGKVKCHDLRHALRLLFSWRSWPSLGPPMAFPDQKQPGVRPGHGHQLWPLLRAFFLFIPPHLPSCRLQSAPSLPGEKHQWPPGLHPCLFAAVTSQANPPSRAPARATLTLGCLSPILYPVGAGRHPQFSFHEPTGVGFPWLAHMAALLFDFAPNVTE